MKLQLIRNATLRVSYSKHKFLTDPYFAEKFSRPSFTGKSKNPLVDLPFPIDDIILGIEMVLVSHIHSDHFDPAAQAILPKEIPLICQVEDELEIKKIGFTKVYPITEGYCWNKIYIQHISGKHGSGDVLDDMGTVSGFFFEAEGEPSIYWAGDTILCDEVKEVLIKKKPNIVIIHSCGAEWGNHVKIVMDEVQAIEVCKLLPESTVVAIHMEALDHATISRQSLREYARKNGIPDKQLLIPDDGDILNFTE